MGRRRASRIIAISALYVNDITNETDIDKILNDALTLNAKTMDSSSIAFAKKLIETVIGRKFELDRIITRNLENWELNRVNPIDRSILRLCTAELLYFPDIPTKSSLDEAIELAKQYGAQDSWRFVNGVLDGILKEIKNDNPIKKKG